MNAYSVKKTRARRLTVAGLAMLLAMMGLFGSSGLAQVPPDEQGNVCLLPGYGIDGCTANDFAVETIKVVAVHESCSEDTIGELEVTVQVVLSTANATRYDPSFFLGLDGSATAGLDGDECYHGYLSEPPDLTTNPTYVAWHPDGILNDIVDGPWWTSGDDVCGDMEPTTSAVKTVGPLRLPCTDHDGNGFADIHSCASYKQNSQDDCAGVTQAIPGTSSKCQCSIKNFDPAIPYVPAAIDLVSFSAAAQEGDILVTWETATEIDNLGFNVYRAEAVEGAHTQLNARLIPSQAPGSAVGATYRFVDATAVAGVSYSYWLEDVDLSGQATFHGPVSAELPLVRRLMLARPRLAPIRTWQTTIR